MEAFFTRVQHYTESFLTWRKRRKIHKQEKQKKKNVILDWVEAFIWAAFFVLIINQYFFQAYQIPSGSMEDTLKIGDRIFVNKFIFGPELVPGKGKMSGFTEPERGEIIIFRNPTYISKGPFFDIATQLVYMLTLSMVNLDTNEAGEPKPHYLIKRAVGMGEDRLRLSKGNMLFKPEGEENWLTEEEFKKIRGLDYHTKRFISEDEYSLYENAGAAMANKEMGFSLNSSQRSALQEMQNNMYLDYFAFNYYRAQTLLKANPHNNSYRSVWKGYELGWYIPEGHVFPMGDSRDNSRDARYFGTLQKSDVLGQAIFRYWPLQRFGTIQN